MKRVGMRAVHQRGTRVVYSGGPWAGWGWNPFLGAGGGSIDIRHQNQTFILDFQLTTGRWALELGVVCMGALWMGSMMDEIGFSWFPLVWLVGVGGTVGAYRQLVTVPERLARLITPDDG